MENTTFFKSRIWFTAVVATAIWALLSYQQYHGGVPSHHLLANEALPSFSNWWGALLLPVLTWFLLYRIEKRAFPEKEATTLETSQALRYAFYGFASALLFGGVLSVFFTLGTPTVPGYMLLGVFALALFLPVYRAQCLLGFVVAMTYTFGAVLPTGIGLIVSLINAAIYLFVRPAILFAFFRLARKQKAQF